MKLVIFLTIGTIAMFAVMFIGNGSAPYRFRIWKLLLSTVVLTLAGVLGAYLMAWLESGSFGGRSFYGAVFLPPAIMAFTALLLKLPAEKLIDLSAVGECIMLAILKVQCIRDGCCGGRPVINPFSGESFIFPSQEVELINALVIMVVLLLIISRRKNTGRIYPLYMIIYGISRFVLNLFRDTSPFVWILPAGTFWSLISIAAGFLWLFVLRRTRNRKKA